MNCNICGSSLDSEKSNIKALEHLKNGADGILFELPGETDFESLCKGISWNHASINFSVSVSAREVAQSLIHYVERKVIAHTCLPGAFFGDEVVMLPESQFRMTGFTMTNPANVAENIAAVFKNILEVRGPSLVTNQVAIRVSVNQDFFLSMATLRAIRTVWKRILELRAIPDNKLFILAHSPVWSDANYQPHANMLKSTTAAIASVLGGCDVLSIDDENSQSAMTAKLFTVLSPSSCEFLIHKN